METDEALLALLKQPKSSQQLRDAMSCSGAQVNELLYRLRDSGLIAFANGQWYKIRGVRIVNPRAKKLDPRQEKLFK